MPRKISLNLPDDVDYATEKLKEQLGVSTTTEVLVRAVKVLDALAEIYPMTNELHFISDEGERIRVIIR